MYKHIKNITPNGKEEHDKGPHPIWLALLNLGKEVLLFCLLFQYVSQINPLKKFKPKAVADFQPYLDK